MFTLEFETENEAFTDDPQAEIVRILQNLVRRIEHGEEGGAIMDVNGNKVGSFCVND